MTAQPTAARPMAGEGPPAGRAWADSPADLWPLLPPEVRAAGQDIGATAWRQAYEGLPCANVPWRATRPLFMRHSHLGELGDLSVRLAKLVLAACGRRAANAGELHDLLGIPAGQLPLLDRSAPLADDLLISMRPDIMYQHGVPKFVELNIDGGVGLTQQADLIAARYLRLYTDALPGVSGWLRAPRSSVDGRFAAIRAAMGNGATRAVIPVFQVGTVGGLDRDPQVFMDWLAPQCDAGRSYGFDTLTCPLPDLRLDGQDRLCARGLPVDVVIRLFLYSDQPPSPGVDALGRAVRAGTVAMHTPEATCLLMDKRTLAWLWDDLALLGEPDAELVRRHVPWTAELPAGTGPDDPLMRRAFGDREGMVLKPGDGHGGKGVTIGAQSDEDGWRRALADAAAHGGYVLQEYTYPDLIELDFEQLQTGERRTARVPFTMGPFLFGLRPTGVLIRLGAPAGDLVINIHNGALPNSVLLVGPSSGPQPSGLPC